VTICTFSRGCRELSAMSRNRDAARAIGTGFAK
jgi:hypothetical protein